MKMTARSSGQDLNDGEVEVVHENDPH